ncbi:MAG: nucleotidyltransferase [Bacteroidetes bacterium 4572_128]|nr:MAG: nucleotidyltransferase [Bacteroidetes bacterium 4572_128]
MKIIIPMAGMGKRMRPHTLTVPKPLISIAGKSIVERLVTEISKIVKEEIEEIAYIIREDFGEEVEKNLKEISNKLSAKSSIYYQKEAKGTAHAVFCAENSLDGNVIIAFADTLFKADFNLNKENDATIFVKKVKNPNDFGVVKTNKENLITDFIEKPKEFISDLAIIGIYFFKDGKNLKKEIKYLIDNKIIVNNEYQLTDVLENMKEKNISFKAEVVNEWLEISKSAEIINSVILEPSFIDCNVKIENSVIAKHVSIGKYTKIKNSIIENSIIQENSIIENANITNSMIGNFVEIRNKKVEMSVGDFNSF